MKSTTTNNRLARAIGPIPAIEERFFLIPESVMQKLRVIAAADLAAAVCDSDDLGSNIENEYRVRLTREEVAAVLTAAKVDRAEGQ